MPLTPYQEEVARLLSANRTYDSYLAGGAAIHLEPHTTRYSNDLDYFHDSVERVAEAFLQDQGRLTEAGHEVTVEMRLPGYLRATVSRRGAATKVEWAHDSAWRFMPTIRNDIVGYVLHPIDLAINKLLAVVGRDEPRDFARLRLTEPIDLPALKTRWLTALSDADAFIRSRPPDEAGCLYYSRRLERFVTPGPIGHDDAVPHYGRPGGVLPRVLDESS